MGVADTYLASFQPVAPVAGFGLVKDTAMTEALAQANIQNASIGLAMAQQGLTEFGAATRQKDLLDAQARENELTRRANRRAGIGRMAGQLFGGGAGLSLPSMQSTDPLALYQNLDNFLRYQGARRGERTASSRGYGAGVIQQLGQGLG